MDVMHSRALSVGRNIFFSVNRFSCFHHSLKVIFACELYLFPVHINCFLQWRTTRLYESFWHYYSIISLQCEHSVQLFVTMNIPNIIFSRKKIIYYLTSRCMIATLIDKVQTFHMSFFRKYFLTCSSSGNSFN